MFFWCAGGALAPAWCACDQEANIFYYPCPCGDKFQISVDELLDGEGAARAALSSFTPHLAGRAYCAKSVATVYGVKIASGVLLCIPAAANDS